MSTLINKGGNQTQLTTRADNRRTRENMWIKASRTTSRIMAPTREHQRTRWSDFSIIPRLRFEMETYWFIGFNQLVDDMSGSWSYCDYVTYLYFLISVFLFTMGFIISVFSMGWFKDTVFANLGHMWMVGPLFMCTGVLFGVRNVLFLRRRRDIDIVIRQQIEVSNEQLCSLHPQYNHR